MEINFIPARQFCERIFDGTHDSPKESFFGHHRLITSKNIVCGTVDQKDALLISDDDYNSIQRRSAVKKNDVLFSMIGTIGNVCYIKNEPDYAIKNIGVFRCKTEEDALWLYIYLQSDIAKAYIKKLMNGSIQKFLALNKLEEFPIPQKPASSARIISVMQGIENQIKRNQDMCHKLQVLAQTIYSRWFNQFEFPNEDGLPYKSSGGKMVWNDELEREIPESWTVDEVLNLINWQSSSQPPKSDFSSKMQDGYIRFIQNRDYDSNTHITYIPIATSTKTCTQYDIMIDKYGDAGKTRYGLCGAYNVALAKIEPIFNNHQEYLRKYFEQEHVYRFLHKACIASTRASLNENILSDLTIVVPDNKTLILFENLQKEIINQILDIQKGNNHLQLLKKSILPLLINGQLKI